MKIETGVIRFYLEWLGSDPTSLPPVASGTRRFFITTNIPVSLKVTIPNFVYIYSLVFFPVYSHLALCEYSDVPSCQVTR
jgi:hypothetical protein